MDTTACKHTLDIGNVLRQDFQLSLNCVPITGATVTARIKRLSDNKYWTGAAWGSITTLTLTEYDSTNFKGYYYYSLTPDAGPETILVTIKYNDGTNDLYEMHVWEVGFDYEKYTIEYDFVSYSKAVLLYYPMKRTVSGNPSFWRYLYKEAGGNPANTSEIAKADVVTAWAVETPA
jgi:hypothetical protein